MTPVWLVIPDPFSARLFFEAGIVDGLHARLGERLELFLDAGEETWAERAPGVAVTRRDELASAPVPRRDRAWRRADTWIDRQIGFYPLSLRQSVRHGFNRERLRPGHDNWFLNTDLAGPLPDWAFLDAPMRRWHFGRLRYLPPELRRRFERERPAVALSNIQMQAVVPFVVGARRHRLPIVGHVASWDHTVGKGIVAPSLGRYVVQNDVMREDLVRYHHIERDRIAVTGWPQTDVYSRRRPRSEYDRLVGDLGLDAKRPIVLVMGNSPTNAPYEGRFVERIVDWWEARARARFSLLFRPHPRDRQWRERFAPALDRGGVAVQEPSFRDLETLALLLQHGDCVVSNAGTILLDALVNDRPAVCVLYDEGAPPGESFALKNVTGEHYRQLIQSDAFYRASTFDDVVAGVERALERPGELEAERMRVARQVVGEVDGRAGARVVEAISAVVG